MPACLLTINGGSSSIKFALYAPGDPPQRVLSGAIERIGSTSAVLRLNDVAGQSSPGAAAEIRGIDAHDQGQAIDQVLDVLEKRVGREALIAIGHRIVHGGTRFSEPQIVAPAMIAELKRLIPLDPDHLPEEIALLEAFGRRFPGVPQVACFDTAFHHDLPRVARMLPIPRRYEAQGVRRFGFHGLSYGYLMEELARVAGPDAARGRVILAHLGAGASLAAMHAGKCIDTTMAFTPTAGLVMGTRSGDLDPGLFIYLLRKEQMTADQFDHLVNRESGLLGISETSSDMRELTAAEASDPRAAEAIAMFCYQAKKWIGAYAAALGGLDTLVFSGGIGENSSVVRERICQGLDFLGIQLDSTHNAAGAAVISAGGSRVKIRVIRTDEELMIAQEIQHVLGDRLQR